MNRSIAKTYSRTGSFRELLVSGVVISVAQLLLVLQVLSYWNELDRLSMVAIAIIGLVTGIILPFVCHFHNYRILGLVPPATLMTFLAVISAPLLGLWMAHVAMFSFGTGIIMGVSLAFSQWCRSAAGRYRNPTIWKSPTFDLLFQLFWFVLGTILMIVLLFNQMKGLDRAHEMVLHPLSIGFASVLLVGTWIIFFRPFFELCVEAVVWRNYSISKTGPGAKDLPLHGPLIVIANHACWWDPLFLAKALPRPVTPMMTSLFYDKWFLKPLVKYIFGTIRVPDARARREAPEIQDAIRALDEGKCLILFPEGYLRRKEEVPLRRFGRGIWEILKARPDTPVVCCWIEGAWGSYASYWNGPPTKNKVIVRRRPIAIGLSEPITVPAEKLERHLATRIFLMNEVSAARKHLGLEPLPAFELPAKDDEAASEEST